MRLIVVGPPGSGKGTQTQLLRERRGWPTFSTGDLLREAIRLDTPAGRRAKPFVAAGRLVPDELVNDIVAQLFHIGAAPEHFVMDGYPRNQAQAQTFDKVLEQQRLPLDAVIFLNVPDDELVRRLSGRGREDDQVDIIRQRLEIFHAQTREILDHYRRRNLVVEVAGSGDVESIYRNLEQTLKQRTDNLNERP